MNIISNWFVFVRVAGNQGYTSGKVFSLKIFEHIGIGMVHLHVFFNNNA